MDYVRAPSGGPLVQHVLLAMLQMVDQGIFTLDKIVEKLCHAPADLFNVVDRGYIREGYYADLVLVDTHKNQVVNKENILYKCGWSPFEGTTFKSRITHTFINGNLVFENSKFHNDKFAKRLTFNR